MTAAETIDIIDTVFLWMFWLMVAYFVFRS